MKNNNFRQLFLLINNSIAYEIAYSNMHFILGVKWMSLLTYSKNAEICNLEEKKRKKILIELIYINDNEMSLYNDLLLQWLE